MLCCGRLGVFTAVGQLKRLLVLAVLMLSSLCSSCAERPLQGVLIPAAETTEDASRVPILIATTRQRSSSDPGEMFNADRAPAMSYARLDVSIPPDDSRKIGDIQWPASPPGDPHRDFVTVSAEYLDRPGFSAALAAVAKAKRRSKAMVFVHGFNNRFDDAVYRLAQIVQDSKAPVIPVLFSWPSRGVVSLSAYEYDRLSASQSAQSLEEVLDTIARVPSIKEITVVCHSMGCQLAMESLRSLSIRTGKIDAKVRNVLLVAPDVEFNVFREQLQQIGGSRPRFALFLSQDDHALKISKSIFGGATRLGDINPEQEPYKSDLAHQKILVFDVTHLEGDDPHSRAFDDVRSVMGMIERRLATGQQLEEDDPKRVAVVAQ